MSAMVHPCPKCGAAFQLTPEYLAQYGGQTTQCPTCSTQFVLPDASVFQQQAYAAPAYGGGYAAPAGYGAPAGYAQPQYGAPGVIPYASPAAASNGVWVEGTKVVAVKGAFLPPCCIKCGGAPEGRPITKTFYWHHPAIFIAALSPLIYIILALVLRKSGALTYSLCKKHRARKTWGIVIGLGSLFGAIVMFILAGANDMPELIIVGILLLFVGVIAGLLMARVVYPAQIDERFVWLNGAGKEFLGQLQSVHAAAPYAGGYVPR